ncbi:MAG: GTPase domain-containing protein [Chloroflexi bacterium]|nr:GTPase domain-containing protein [Chloroflexota bacterium]
MTRDDGFFALRDSLRSLRDTLPALREAFGVTPPEGEAPTWQDKLARNVLPALDFDLPVLLVAIAGGGSTGKSTIFNTLAGAPLSQTGFRAGLTARVILAGHPRVLSGERAAEALLYRLGQSPAPWRAAEDSLQPGPPLYVTSKALPPNLLLIDTPDFDTGNEGRLVNRARAEPVLRTAEVIVYVFSNTVYNNLSNTQFLADVVGGIGGRPIVLVYRISRAARDEEVLEHCRVVAGRLYPGSIGRDGFPGEVIGVYRMHESDAVAQGEALPKLFPLGRMTAGRTLSNLLASLDVAPLKRHAFAADLREIHRGAAEEAALLRHQARTLSLYRQALQQAMAQQALEALQAFPAQEAIALATRLFLESSPKYVRWLRATGKVVGLPFHVVRKVGQEVSRRLGSGDTRPSAPDPLASLSQDLLLSANELRNRLLDDALIVQATEGDPLLAAVRAEASRPAPDGLAPLVEPLDSGLYNLHVPAPRAIREQEAVILAQDWQEVTAVLREAAERLLGLPLDIEEELRALVGQFRAGMGWAQRLRETFFASLSALPPILGVTYTLLTANPVVGSGIWIQLESVFGINDLWALVSIPAAAGLTERDRKQLEQMIRPVFQLWFERRLQSIVQVYGRTVCRPVLEILDGLPGIEDSRFARVDEALRIVAEAG